MIVLLVIDPVTNQETRLFSDSPYDELAVIAQNLNDSGYHVEAWSAEIREGKMEKDPPFVGRLYNQWWAS